jgi:hypothetical protein
VRKVELMLLLSIALFAAGAVAAAPIRSVSVTAQLTSGGAAGRYLNVNCTPRGSQLAGSRTLYGVNPQTGCRYSYPVVISGSRTSGTALLLTATFAAGYPLTINATTPSGGLTFIQVLPTGLRWSPPGGIRSRSSNGRVAVPCGARRLHAEHR